MTSLHHPPPPVQAAFPWHAPDDPWQARKLGRALGLSGSGICEPPPGYSPAERSAYREGYAAGLARRNRGGKVRPPY